MRSRVGGTTRDRLPAWAGYFYLTPETGRSVVSGHALDGRSGQRPRQAVVGPRDRVEGRAGDEPRRIGRVGHRCGRVADDGARGDRDRGTVGEKADRKSV